MDERIGFGLYQSCENRGSVGRVSVFWLRCESGFTCRWQVQVYVYCAWRIPAHLRCTQCSILLHLMDICILKCICLLQISQIQTRLCDVVGPGLVSTPPDFVRSSASHPSDPHGRLAQKTVNRAPIAGAGRFDTICTAVCDRCDSFTACRLCRLEPLQ